MRKMNRGELSNTLEGAGLYDMKKYSMQTLELMARDLGISTEVAVK
jgi:hypothetical protein